MNRPKLALLVALSLVLAATALPASAAQVCSCEFCQQVSVNARCQFLGTTTCGAFLAVTTCPAPAATSAVPAEPTLEWLTVETGGVHSHADGAPAEPAQ